MCETECFPALIFSIISYTTRQGKDREERERERKREREREMEVWRRTSLRCCSVRRQII